MRSFRIVYCFICKVPSYYAVLPSCAIMVKNLEYLIISGKHAG